MEKIRLKQQGRSLLCIHSTTLVWHFYSPLVFKLLPFFRLRLNSPVVWWNIDNTYPINWSDRNYWPNRRRGRERRRDFSQGYHLTDHLRRKHGSVESIFVGSVFYSCRRLFENHRELISHEKNDYVEDYDLRI